MFFVTNLCPHWGQVHNACLFFFCTFTLGLAVFSGNIDGEHTPMVLAVRE